MTSGRMTFREAALASGLMTRNRLRDVTDILRRSQGGGHSQATKITDEQLAVKLVEMEQLTQYQADQLLLGHTKLALGPYTINDWLGQGGMGQVFKAIHQVMDREVAIKVLPLSRNTPAAIEAFSREIRAQARLDHPNLVRAYDAGHDGNVHYLVTEYVPGTDLRRLIRDQGQLNMHQAATVASQAAQALGHAHAAGLVHRDVKPGNMLVTPDGQTKVADLGLVGFIDEWRENLCAGKIVGTADYMAPEVVTAPDQISAVSDIYSLGCTLYYASTGKVPFPGGTFREKLQRHCETPPWHPHAFNIELSEEFVDVIADMMEKDPDARIQSADEVVSRLKPWTQESGPRPVPRKGKSSWALPPVVSAQSHAENVLESHDERLSEQEPVDWAPDIGIPISEETFRVGSTHHDTSVTDRLRRRRSHSTATVDLATAARNRQVWESATVALAIAIPLAMFTGAFLMGILLRFLRD